MTPNDHRAEAERKMREHSTYGPPSTVVHLLAAIHDELHAIRDRMTEPRWIVPEPAPEPDDDTCCDCHLAGVVERVEAVKERDRARHEAEALAEEVDGLRSERAVALDTIERLREERDRARTQVISLTDERDDWQWRWQMCDRAWAEDRAALRALRDALGGAE